MGALEKCIVEMELLAGFEPATSSLPMKCSTTELQQPTPLSRGMDAEPRGRGKVWTRNLGMERANGLEPSSLAWKAKVLPLNYARIESGLSSFRRK